jgi:hypothetical protein
MEESGSEGLDDMIKAEVKKGKEGWFDGVDCVCIVSTAMFSYFASPIYPTIVGQLLAQHSHTCDNLRSSWTYLFQFNSVWPYS